MTCATTDLTIRKGETFSRVLRWETTPIVYKAISAITAAAPPVITATGHGIPDGWSVAVISAGGMTEINALNWPLKRSDFHKATKLTDDTISLNDVNAAEYTAYTSGGYVAYNTPTSLSGLTARMQIRASKNASTTLLELTTENSRIALDDTLKTITLTITAADTEDLTFTKGVYDLEMINGTVVTRLLQGNIIVDGEVTR